MPEPGKGGQQSGTKRPQLCYWEHGAGCPRGGDYCGGPVPRQPLPPPSPPTLTPISSTQGTTLCGNSTLASMLEVAPCNRNSAVAANNGCGPVHNTLYYSVTVNNPYVLASLPRAKVDSSNQSVVDNSSFNYHHIAYDYRPAAMPSGSQGCSSCGGGGDVAPDATKVMQLQIERRHRYRDQAYWQSSFGPGSTRTTTCSCALHGQQDSQRFAGHQRAGRRVVRSAGNLAAAVYAACGGCPATSTVTAGLTSTT